MLQMDLVKMQKWKNKEKICYIGEFLVTTTGSTLLIGQKAANKGQLVQTERNTSQQGHRCSPVAPTLVSQSPNRCKTIF